jgi:cadmium resistance protein CadD (predicted permease)
MIGTLVSSFLAFVSTNIDDVFLLMMLFAPPERFSGKQIIAGQFLGISALIILSLLGMLAGFLVAKQYIGLLGFFPIYLGIRNLARKENNNIEPVVAVPRSGVFFFIDPLVISIAGVTIANGGDNVGVYVPFFSTISRNQLMISITVFLLLTFILTRLVKILVTHPVVAERFKVSSKVFPFLLISLGLYILADTFLQ